VNTTYREIKDTRQRSGYGDIETEVFGDLADRIRLRAGAEGPVKIIEKYWNSGYCETCSYDEHDFRVYVNGVEVWDSSYEYVPDGVNGLTSFGEFNSWLEGGD